MEAASLTTAHAHARKAAEESHKARLTLAATEHESAAGEFAKAAHDTGDAEALRILRLLEEHHHKLAQIIKTRDVVARALPTARDSPTRPINPGPQSPTALTYPTPSPHTTPPAMPKLTERRDSSPALAKDMASRRGIPQAQHRRPQGVPPNLSTLQATGRMATPQERLDANTQDTKEVSDHADHADQDVESNAEVPHHEDGFAKFYSNLTSGPLSKLSSMLAFAGLPLAEESSPDLPTLSRTDRTDRPDRPDRTDRTDRTDRSERTTARASSGPDVKQIFSKAALRALEEQQRNQGFSGSTFGPGESFYLIPDSGPTISYADMLKKAQHDGQRTLPSDEFVDARETQRPQSPGQTRRHPSAPAGPPAGSVREEELLIENGALKQILDKLSHRLQAFESHAQDASMAALTQSMASIRPRPAASVSDNEERLRGLEAQMEREMRERERLVAENQKQKMVIAKYRSHWEQLKNSARAKEKAKREALDSRS